MSESEITTGASADLRALIDRGISLAKSGNLRDAEALFRNVLEQDPDSVAAHNFFGALAFRQGRHEEAIAAYETCARLQPREPAFHVNVAHVKEQAGDAAGAAEAWLAACRLEPRNPRFLLFAGAALEAAGRREEAAVLFTLGDELSPVVRGARNQPKLPPEIRRRSATADRVIREHLTGLQKRALDEAEELARHENGSAAPDLSRVRSAMWVQTHDGPISFPTPAHQPTILYLPELAPVPVTSRGELSWAESVEAAMPDILAEYRKAVESGTEMAPYVEESTRNPKWSALRGRTDWSSLHLFKQARETPSAKHFPKTLATLEKVDVFRLEGGRPTEIFFSRLKPGTHIPPHTGISNHRLTVHLPLIVPNDCAIRVERITHAWREGEIFAFDDSFEHEAWNRSDSERVVLIFESHRPDVNADERLAIEHMFNVRERWLAARRIPGAA